MLDKNTVDIRLNISDVNKMSVSSKKFEGVRYAYYIYKGEEIIARFPYTDSNTLTYWLSESGEYRAYVFFLNEKDEKVSYFSEPVVFNAEEAFGLGTVIPEKKSLWKCVTEISGEIFCNRTILTRMASFDYMLRNKDTYLGKIWALLTPLIQIGTYWLVFGVGIRNGRDVDGFPYLAWMLVGLVPWFFISGCITRGANSIYAKAGLVTKMKFPISTVPVSQVLQEMYEFIVSLGIMLVILLFQGVYPSIYWLNLIYYFVFSVAFLVSMALVTSVFTMVARDTFKLLTSIIRLLFYLTPILWVMDSMPKIYQDVMKLNPIYYIVNGFRESILYNIPFYAHIKLAVAMWGITIILYVIGCILQSKFKNKFIDLM